MAGLIVGDHDPIVMGRPGWGSWVECECGWISANAATEDHALVLHSLHVTKAGA